MTRLIKLYSLALVTIIVPLSLSHSTLHVLLTMDMGLMEVTHQLLFLFNYSIKTELFENSSSMLFCPRSDNTCGTCWGGLHVIAWLALSHSVRLLGLIDTNSNIQM